MKKLAVIDIGSNNARMIIVHIFDNGSFGIVDELKEPVRLISDMTQDNIIRPRRIQQLIKTLLMFKRLCAANEVVDIIAVLTAAVRRAANQRSFLDEVYSATGINLTLLTGEQEAIYVYQGVINSMDIDAGVIMDIGGGNITYTYASVFRNFDFSTQYVNIEIKNYSEKRSTFWFGLDHKLIKACVISKVDDGYLVSFEDRHKYICLSL